MNVENALIHILTETLVEQQSEIVKIKDELDELDEWQDAYSYYFTLNTRIFPCECDSCQVKTVVSLDDDEASRICGICEKPVHFCVRCAGSIGVNAKHYECQ